MMKTPKKFQKRRINFFRSPEGSEFFCEVDEIFVGDNFNLWGLKKQIDSKIDKALEMILSKEIPQEEDLSKPN